MQQSKEPDFELDHPTFQADKTNQCWWLSFPEATRASRELNETFYDRALRICLKAYYAENRRRSSDVGIVPPTSYTDSKTTKKQGDSTESDKFEELEDLAKEPKYKQP